MLFSQLIVDADTIIVRAPYNKDKIAIQKLVLDKAKWILNKQKESREMTPDITKPSSKEDTTIPYLGHNYFLKEIKNQERNSIEIADGKFVVVKSAKISKNVVKRLYENWIIEKAQSIFEGRVRKYSKKLRIRLKPITLKNLNNRWRSLMKSGIIVLNLNLIKAPEDISTRNNIHNLEISESFADILNFQSLLLV